MLYVNCIYDFWVFFLKWNLDYLIIKFYVFKFKGVFGSKIYLVVYI